MDSVLLRLIRLGFVNGFVLLFMFTRAMWFDFIGCGTLVLTFERPMVVFYCMIMPTINA